MCHTSGIIYDFQSVETSHQYVFNKTNYLKSSKRDKCHVANFNRRYHASNFNRNLVSLITYYVILICARNIEQ
jgi:hypothetical protein